MISSSNLYFMKRVRIHIHTWVNTIICSTLLTVMLVWELIYVLIESGSCNRKKIVTIAQKANSFTWKTACELQSHINIVFWIVNKIFIMLQIKMIWIALLSCCLSLIFYWPSLLSCLMRFSFHNATRTCIFLNSVSILTYLYLYLHRNDKICPIRYEYKLLLVLNGSLLNLKHCYCYLY